MRQYRIKEEIFQHGSRFTPQYKDEDCSGYYNPSDPDAVAGYTEFNTFLVKDLTYDHRGLIVFTTNNLQEAMDKIEDDKNKIQHVVKVIYHEIN